MKNENLEVNPGNGKMIIGPESKVYLYYGEGMDKFDHAVVERPDARDPLSDPEFPNPKQYIFDKNMIRFLSGLAIPDDNLHPDVVDGISGIMKEQVGQNLELEIQQEPDDYVRARRERHDKSRIVPEKPDQPIYVPESWTAEYESNPEINQSEDRDPNDILLDYGVEHIARGVKYGYFPVKWAMVHQADNRKKEIFGSQLRYQQR